MNSHPAETVPVPSRLATILESVPPGLRGAVLIRVAASARNEWLESRFAVGELRDAFADYWKNRFGDPVPLSALRSALNPPVPIRTVIEFNKLELTRDAADIDTYLNALVQYLADGNQVERCLF